MKTSVGRSFALKVLRSGQLVPKLILCIFALSLINGCAAGPKVESYPSRQIDQPFTIPLGMKAWKTIVVGGYFEDEDQTYFLPPIPVPLFWEVPVSEKWSIEFLPVPLSAKYQIQQGPESLTGLRLAMGAGYTSLRGLVLTPRAEPYHRQNFSQNFAWYLAPGYDRTFYAKGQTRENWRADVRTGPMFQLTDRQMISPNVTIALSRSDQPLELSGSDDDEITYQLKDRVTVPLGLQYALRLSPQWEMNLSYQYLGIGYEREFQSHLAGAIFSHYW